MLGAESQFKNNSNQSNQARNRNVSGLARHASTTAQVSCTTTTLIKYRVNNFDHHANANQGAATVTSSQLPSPSPPPPSHGNRGHGGEPLPSTLLPPCDYGTATATATAKTTTTTTFGVSNNKQPQQQQYRNMQQSTDSSEKDKEKEKDKLLRPPFVTTVTRGKFLPSKFDLLVEKSQSLFTFSSRPRPVHLIKKHHCCASNSSPSPAPTRTTPMTTTTPTTGRFTFSRSSRTFSTTHDGRSATCMETGTETGATSRNEGSIPSRTSNTTPPRGAHDYYNVMWDPHVVRGTTAATTRVSDSVSVSREVKSTTASVAESQNEATKLPRIKRSSTNQKPGVRTQSQSRFKPFSNSVVSPLPPIPARHSTMIQTDKFLEELPGDDDRATQVHQCIQTEPIHEAQISSKSKAKAEAEVQAKYGVDNSTQILPGELFFFDDEVQPILESLIGKLLEQAMFETVEEEEIAALREEKNRFNEQRRAEEKELHELQREHERISAEKEQLKRRLDDERNNLSSQHSSAKLSSEFFTREATESFQRVSGGTTVYTTSYLLELLPSVLNSLRQEGFLNDAMDEDAFSRAASSVQRLDSSSSPPIGKEDDGGEEETAEAEGEGQEEGQDGKEHEKELEDAVAEEQEQEQEQVLDIDINATTTIPNTNETQAEISYKDEMSTKEENETGNENETDTVALEPEADEKLEKELELELELDDNSQSHSASVSVSVSSPVSWSMDTKTRTSVAKAASTSTAHESSPSPSPSQLSRSRSRSHDHDNDTSTTTTTVTTIINQLSSNLDGDDEQKQ